MLTQSRVCNGWILRPHALTLSLRSLFWNWRSVGFTASSWRIPHFSLLLSFGRGKKSKCSRPNRLKKVGASSHFFRKESSMVMEGEQNGLRVRNGVHCKVTWTQGPASEAQLEAFGEYNEEFEQSVFITPEYKVPRVNTNMTLDWTKNEELHPFWFVKRWKPLTEDIPNMELVYTSRCNRSSHVDSAPWSRRCLNASP